MKILVTAHALVGGAAMLGACGQKGPLFLPNTPESEGRATLPQTLKPWPAQPATGTPAETPRSSTETTAPVASPPGAPAKAPLIAPAAPKATPP
ncbi:lipoprotein [Limnohabitans sp. 2KL-17]|uniref:LPS translocon maturation chaperone LptM n=1 Tax=Limnohabitans sp. 2KL-17 TaxID=1100704 RepID=UPI001E3D2087|nr:lipoprotein [Limnohabitans sp. 2KL-17]